MMKRAEAPGPGAMPPAAGFSDPMASFRPPAAPAPPAYRPPGVPVPPPAPDPEASAKSNLPIVVGVLAGLFVVAVALVLYFVLNKH